MRFRAIFAGAVLATAAMSTASSALAAADLTGDTLHGYYIFPNDGAVQADLGTFAAPGGGHIYFESYQVTGDQLIVTADATGVFWLPLPYNGLQFVDETAGGPVITGVTLNPASTAHDLGTSVASWTDHSFEVNLHNEHWGPNETAIFDIRFAQPNGGGSGAPEPTTWAMMVAGFAGLGAALRRRRTVAWRPRLID